MEYIFELFPILAERRHQAGGTLSGGEQQMLAISRALMAQPQLLLMDEPSLGLAPLVVKLIFEIISKINSENNTTVFLVEQNANLALKVAHRGYVMETGRITLADSAKNLLANEEVKRAYLGM
jgi:branched-chain amino acid transport system ATP-binding protein